MHCCTSAGLLDLRNGFPSLDPVTCGVAASVVAIVGPGLTLNGTLASGIWSAFADSLQVLDLAGETLRHHVQQC